MTRPLILIAILACCWLWVPRSAHAATTCSLVGTTPLNFGTVTGDGTVDATGSVTLNCTTTAVSLLAKARVRMCINIGTGDSGGGQINPRRMTNPAGDPMQFQIFQDPARTEIWGHRDDPTAPTPRMVDVEYDVPLIVGASRDRTFVLYGRVPAQAGLAAGAHANLFAGTHARVDYRYAETILGSPPYPASCIGGGNGGGSFSFPFSASASVPHHCSINAATDLDFGSVPGLIENPHDQTSSVTVTCTGRTAWRMSMDDGLHAAGGQRRMRRDGGTDHVRYELYGNPGRTQRWGADSTGLTGTGTGSSQTLTVYGRVPGGQAVPAGRYSDTITVTVTY